MIRPITVGMRRTAKMPPAEASIPSPRHTGPASTALKAGVEEGVAEVMTGSEERERDVDGTREGGGDGYEGTLSVELGVKEV
jgi:hypothetical protein